MVGVSSQTCYYLAELGYKTTLVAEGKEATPTELVLDRLGKQSHPNFHVRTFSKYVGKFLLVQKFYANACAFVLRDRNPQKQTVVITRNYDGLPFLWNLKRKGILSFFESHRFTLSKIHPKFWHLSRNVRFEMKLYEKLFLNKTSGILATTPSLKEAYTYIPMRVPVSINRYGCQHLKSYTNSYSAKAIAYAGSIEEARGFGRLLEVVAALPREYTLHVIGVKNDADKARVFGRAEGAGLDKNRITLVPWLSHGELLAYLNTHISLGVAFYRETFFNVVEMSPTKIFDYFSAGLPVVTRSLASTQDVVESGKTGELYSMDTVAAITSAILKIMASETVYSGYLKGVEAFRAENPVNRKALDIVQFSKELCEPNV